MHTPDIIHVPHKLIMYVSHHQTNRQTSSLVERPYMDNQCISNDMWPPSTSSIYKCIESGSKHA